MPPIFVFVVDTCMAADELKALKESIQVGLSLIVETEKIWVICELVCVLIS